MKDAVDRIRANHHGTRQSLHPVLAPELRYVDSIAKINERHTAKFVGALTRLNRLSDDGFTWTTINNGRLQ